MTPFGEAHTYKAHINTPGIRSLTDSHSVAQENIHATPTCGEFIELLKCLWPLF